MRISFRWLKKYIDVKLSVSELAEALTMIGLEVEDELNLGYEDKKIVIGQIKEINKHPNADKLSYCKVDVGDRILDIVCGAKNMKEGDKVVVALPGAKLPNGLKLKKTRIRGCVSEGMMCSEAELGLAKSSEGIMILDPSYPVGEGFDYIFELGITPNRPDCLSLIGVAREVQAIVLNSVKMPLQKIVEQLEETNLKLKVEIENKAWCPRYTARVLEQVKIAPSPLWLQNALVLAGMRPINNIVDVTNFVLWEMGHPLHAFDYDLIKDKTIIVRNAKEGEIIKAVDERTYVLSQDMLVIADSSRPIAIAGIIGGKNTEISEETINVVLESAYFNPQCIRRTSKKLGITTEASYRFERGSDYNALPIALNRAASLIQQITNCDMTKGIIDANYLPSAKRQITLNFNNVNKILGTKLNVQDISDIAMRLQFEVVSSSKEEVVLSIPSYRVDLNREIDLIEEIARIYGYNNIEDTFPFIDKEKIAKVESVKEKIYKLKNFVKELGLTEIINYTFLSGDFQKKLGFDESKFVNLANPLSREYNVMRISIIPSLIKTYMVNVTHYIKDMSIFEIGKVFEKEKNEYKEEYRLGILLCGYRYNEWHRKEKWDIYYLKGIVEDILEFFGIKKYEISYSNNVLFHPGKSFKIKKDENLLFVGGEIHPSIKEKLDVSDDIIFGEFFLDWLLNQKEKIVKYKELYSFPANYRDLSMIFDKKIPYEEIEAEIIKSGGAYLKKVKLVDIYEHPSLGKDKVSFTFNLVYQHSEKTLSDEEIKPSFEKIIKMLEKKFGAILR